MGGMHGMGPIVREANEPVFHEAWEGRVRALTRAIMVGGHCSLDEYRHGVERIAPSRYLQLSYYERSLEGALIVLLEKGVITRDEFDARVAELTAEEK
jgi:nitrile hydratase